jgi:hypothetical protein
MTDPFDDLMKREGLSFPNAVEKLAALSGNPRSRSQDILNAWLVRTIDGRVRLKWRDEETVLQDMDFGAEAEARAYVGNLLRFLPDLETALQMMGRLRQENPDMSPEEAMERVGIREVKLDPERG